jgi:hypothetical protein
MLYALCGGALPIVFAMGFWARGVVSADVRETASDDRGKSRAAVDLADCQDQNMGQGQVIQSAAPLEEEAFLRPDQHPQTDRQELAAVEAPAPVRDQSRPTISPPQPDQQASGAPGRRAMALNNLQPWGLSSEPEKPTNAAEGFSLRTAREVRQVSAEVIRPVRAWFATATNDDECATGTCPAPVARLDRKLNTGLEWSATPQCAAQEAEREGKLVFLIHVSGNFAQPGFT